MNQQIAESGEKMFSLEGKRALITGSAQGIGRAIAQAFAEFGAIVALHDIREMELLDNALAEVQKTSPGSTAITGDLSEPGAGKRIVDAVTKSIGAPDIVIANASIQIRKPWTEITPEESLEQMQVNFHSTLQIMQAAYPAMRERKWGRMVSIGSVQEKKPHVEMPVYAASKAALENLIRNLAKVVGKDGITINNISPGVFNTIRNKEALSDPAYAAKVREFIPIRDFAQPEDAAGTALLLCSDAGRYINGATICVDGGMSIT
ncbi:MAG: SDR family NAD(P)-dependent oxidoreductase [Kiritimatiellae bacterium]|nr:SDR family NAD(P)-dependent oxidoreductase [Kiritimatiellia bacterium]